MNKKIWVLTVRTSLPDTASNKDDITMTNHCFYAFEDAKKALREKLKEFAFTKNSMFDGKGGLIYLQNYAEGLSDEFTDKQDLSLKKVKELEKALLSIFEGKDESLQMEDVEACTDWVIAMDVTKNTIQMYGYGDRPCEGYDPYIKTNMFVMQEEKDYYLYINDMFGQDCSSELYIDLRQVEVQ